MGSSIGVPQKLTRIIISNNPTSRYLPKGNKTCVSERHLHSHTYCITIHHSQDMELTKIPGDR